MAQKGLAVLVAILPPDVPGSSARVVYDPDIRDGILAYEVAAVVKKLVKKARAKPKETSAA